MAKNRAEFVDMGKEKLTITVNDPFEGVMRNDGRLHLFQSTMVEWFRENGKDYPWRRTPDPYAILVSELMLQQTRIQTVLDRGYYENWMKRFPDCEALAEAGEEEILKAWEGLGYYNRARNLQKAAAMVVTELGGCFPKSLEEMLKLPGVGRYTAGAVLSFAYGKSYPIVDGNVTRVLTRLFAWSQPIDTASGKSQLWTWAEQLTPGDDAREYNSAIMELGQQICSRSDPGCSDCPVLSWCLAGQEGTTGEFPVSGRTAKITAIDENVLLRTDASGRKVWLVPEKGSRRNGLWRLPEIHVEKLDELAEVLQTTYAITRYRVTLKVFRDRNGILPDSVFAGGKWFSIDEPDQFPPLGAPYLRILKEALEY